MPTAIQEQAFATLSEGERVYQTHRLRFLMYDRGISMTELAEELAVTKQYVSAVLDPDAPVKNNYRYGIKTVEMLDRIEGGLEAIIDRRELWVDEFDQDMADYLAEARFSELFMPLDPTRASTAPWAHKAVATTDDRAIPGPRGVSEASRRVAGWPLPGQESRKKSFNPGTPR